MLEKGLISNLWSTCPHLIKTIGTGIGLHVVSIHLCLLHHLSHLWLFSGSDLSTSSIDVLFLMSAYINRRGGQVWTSGPQTDCDMDKASHWHFQLGPTQLRKDCPLNRNQAFHEQPSAELKSIAISFAYTTHNTAHHLVLKCVNVLLNSTNTI